jgi:predicted  nucleic acid-binding Zn-ribbon protein
MKESRMNEVIKVLIDVVLFKIKRTEEEYKEQTDFLIEVLHDLEDLKSHIEAHDIDIEETTKKLKEINERIRAYDDE